VRTGSATTGPVPGTMSTPIPAATSGTTMSLNRIAASTSCLRTGCSVTSQTISGLKQASSIGTPTRSWRYSGSERPACRMNQTGVRLGVSPAAAASSGAVRTAAVSGLMAESVPRALSGRPLGGFDQLTVCITRRTLRRAVPAH
jgi:hypothetical protein